jgi:hypothetical protein
MCPHEGVTTPREAPAIALNESPFLTHPDKPATFRVRLSNDALYAADYELSVDPIGLEDDVEIYVEGLRMDQARGFSFDPQTSTDALVQVYRGSEKYVYDLKFKLSSKCDDNMEAELDVGVEFALKCPAVSLDAKGMSADGKLNVLLSEVDLKVTNLGAQAWLAVDHVESVSLQFLRYADLFWSESNDIEYVFVSQGVTDLRVSEELKLALLTWAHGLSKNEVRIRVNVKCNPGIQVSF